MPALPARGIPPEVPTKNRSFSMNKPLTAPYPYWGGKRRVAAEIWNRLGPVDSYIEPFGGSLAVLLACPYGPRPREVVNDIDGFIPNFYRAVRDDPELVAYYADWPTSHLDLIARKTACVQRLDELTVHLSANPNYYDAEVAGWWVWCVSNDIGLFRERLPGKAWIPPGVPPGPNRDNSIPFVRETGGGRGVSARTGQDGSMPVVTGGTGGRGVSARRDDRVTKNIPVVNHTNGKKGVMRHSIPHVGGAEGQGINAQRDFDNGGMPSVKGPQGVNAQGMPSVNRKDAGNGINAQRRFAPDETVGNRRPFVETHPGGRGINAQNEDGEGVSNKRPFVTARNGVQRFSEYPEDDSGASNKMPNARGHKGVQSNVSQGRPMMNHHQGGGIGIQAQTTHAPESGLGEACSGNRLIPVFQELADRLFRTYILCKDWSTLCSRTVMGLTISDLEGRRKPPICGIFLDPPYATPGRAVIYGQDDLDVAHEVKAWAIKMAQNPQVRIAMAGYVDDYDTFPEGWTRHIWSTTQVRMGRVEGKEHDRTEVVWFSPNCLPEGNLRDAGQSDFFGLMG